MTPHHKLLILKVILLGLLALTVAVAALTYIVSRNAIAAFVVASFGIVFVLCMAVASLMFAPKRKAPDLNFVYKPDPRIYRHQ